MFELSALYSFWWMLPVVIMAAALSFLLYFRTPKESFIKGISYLLFSFRFLVFTILGFLLISPLVKTWEKNIEKPVVILAVDNSKSMVLHGDTDKIREQTLAEIYKIKSGLEQKYKLDTYSFGEEVEKENDFSFSDESTNLSALFEEIEPKYKYRNVGAMVVLSDGISNVGHKPVYSAEELNFPVYSLGMGDTSIHRDYAIKNVVYNKTVFSKNLFPIEVSVAAKMTRGKRTKLSVYHEGKLLESKTLNFSSDNEFQKHIFYLKAETNGLSAYKIMVSGFEGEHNRLNNSKTIFVEVLGEKRKVLMLYESPHPDVSAFKQVLDGSEEYELKLAHYNASALSVKDYSLIIFHQLPAGARKSQSLLQQAKLQQIPFLLVTGAKTELSAFNALGLGVRIKAQRNSQVDSRAVFNPDFSEFVVPKSFTQMLKDFPPLSSPYGEYHLSNSFRTIFYQKIGEVNTGLPLIAVSEQSGRRNAYIFGEGFWRWRMYCYLEEKSHKQPDDFLLKLVRYVSLSKEHSRFDLQWKPRYDEHEELDFNAVVYNASYEPVDGADIQLKIINENKEQFSFAFSASKTSYHLSAGRFPPGVYSFVAKADYGGELFEKKGRFIVDAMDLEAMDLEAKHSVLKRISRVGKGEFFEAAEGDKLLDSLINKEEIVDIESRYIKYKDLIKLPWVLVVIIVLAAIEWFVRKQMGSY